MTNYLNAVNTAVLVGTTVPTMNTWYKWKKLHPDHELAKLLPEYIKMGNSRYWNRDDLWKLIEFKSKLPQGRNGILGEVTQKYVKKGKTNETSNSR